jgi:glycosyltransferase involved in cell wall biosynthesis
VTLRVSVVVPTYNRPALLTRCLAALMTQTLNPDEYEIVVADDAACDDTHAQVKQLAARSAGQPVVRYIAVRDTSGPAAARNAGWRVARGDIIAFTDDDCIPASDWLRSGIAAFQGDVAGVSGKLVMPIPEVPTDYELNAAHLESAEFVTANCFYRRDVLEATGGFDERFQAAWREDCDLHFRVLDTGHRLVKCESAVVVHPVRDAAWGISVRQQRKSMYNALLYKKHPRRYRERIQAAPPWRYYAIVAALIASAGGLFANQRQVSAISLLAWGLLTGRFCDARLSGTSKAPAHIAEMIVTSVVIPPLSVLWRIRGAMKFRVFFL